MTSGGRRNPRLSAPQLLLRAYLDSYGLYRDPTPGQWWNGMDLTDGLTNEWKEMDSLT